MIMSSNITQRLTATSLRYHHGVQCGKLLYSRSNLSLPLSGFQGNVTLGKRFKSSVSASEDIVNTAQPTTAAVNQMPNFDNSKATYESKSTTELLRAAACFRLCQMPFLVDNSELLLNLSRRFLGGTVTDGILKATLFGHFCAGENEKQIQPVLHKLADNGIGSILDYAAESDVESNDDELPEIPDNQTKITRVYDYESEAQCDRHVDVFKKCIQDVKSLGGIDGYAAVKVTALGNPKLLVRMSQAIVEAKNLFEKFDENKDGSVTREEFEHGYKIYFNDDGSEVKDMIDQLDPSGTGHIDYITWSLLLAPKDLHKITANCREEGPLSRATPTEEEIELIEKMYNRGYELAKEASKCNTRLLIDAEQTNVQPAIDSLVLDLQRKYNATDVSSKPIIYNTYQCYLKDAIGRIQTDVERSERFSYHFGAKLVRGAYMETERDLAKSKGLPSPIHDTIEATHQSFDDAIDFLLRQSFISDKNIEIMCATHNQKSLEQAIQAMETYGVDRQKPTISFAQLFGMSDNLTYNLGRHGYRSYKYVPYGQVSEVMPYLIRRARENSSIMGGASRELEMIMEELKRRAVKKIRLS